MSIKRQSIWASSPTTNRGQPTQISADPSGKRIAYASNRSIILRSIDAPEEAVQYNGHTANTTVARFSPSGYYVASGDISGAVRVWDCVGEDLITKGDFHPINGRINDIAWDGTSGKIIPVGDGKERYGYCMTYDTGNSAGDISGHQNVVNTVAIKPTRPYTAASAGDDNSVVFYNGPPLKFKTAYRTQHTNFVQGLAYSPDGNILASVGSDRKIFLWDGKTGEPVAQIEDAQNGHKGGIYSISWHTDSKRFVTASGDQTVKIWDVEAKKCSHTWSFGDTGSVPDQQTGVVWPNRPDDLVISVSNSGNLNYLSENSPTPERVVAGHSKSITSLGLETDGQTLWTGSYEGRICSWDVSKGLANVPESSTHSNQVVEFASSPGRVYSIGMDDTLRTIDAGVKDFTGSVISTDGQPRGLCPGPEPGTVFVVTLNEISVYKDGSKVFYTPIRNYVPTAAAFSALTNTLAVGAQDNQVHLYKISSGDLTVPASPTSTLKSNTSSISALAFSPNAPLLAAGDGGGKIFLYDTSTGELKTSRWAYHTGRVTAINWNKAGTHIVSSALDTHIIVYSAVNYSKNKRALNAHQDGVNAVAWIDDGTVVSAGSDGCVKTWAVVLP